MIYTVWPAEENQMPQDFETEEEAKDYAKQMKLDGYTIECTTGEVV